MGAQGRYWQQFSDLKRNACYIDLYWARTEKIDRSLNIFLALASSSAIATWAVWQQFPLVWGGIIALTQVYQAIKGFLPYSRRLRSLATLGPELSGLAITVETDWLRVSSGKLTDDEIDELYIKYKKRETELSLKHFPGNTLPEAAGLIQKADEAAINYLKAYHGSPA